MKLVIAGKNSIAVDVLKYAIDHLDIQIFVVLNQTETFKNNFQKSLGFYANLWKIQILKLDEVYKHEDAIFLSLEFDTIVKPNLFKTNFLFNIHFSLLPAYKGMYTSALPILHEKYKTGVTLHEIDSGIDTGDIIDQKEITIDNTDTAKDLYTKYIKIGTELVIKNITNLVENNYSSYKQSSKQSTYYGKKSIDYSDLKINYRQTAEQVLRELRAFSFREYQLPKFQNYQIEKGQITKINSTLKPGAIVCEDNHKIQVATIDYDIVLFKDLYKILWNYCEMNDYLYLKKLLTIQKFDLETKTKEGWTALMIAAFNGAFECLELLINYGANINATNYNYTTALMYAKTNYLNTNNKKCLNKLIDSGANLHTKDIFGKTLLDWVKEESTELYNYLREIK
jgi:methionyl-tRNA formyltransferase